MTPYLMKTVYPHGRPHLASRIPLL